MCARSPLIPPGGARAPPGVGMCSTHGTHAPADAESRRGTVCERFLPAKGRFPTATGTVRSILFVCCARKHGHLEQTVPGSGAVHAAILEAVPGEGTRQSFTADRMCLCPGSFTRRSRTGVWPEEPHAPPLTRHVGAGSQERTPVAFAGRGNGGWRDVVALLGQLEHAPGGLAEPCLAAFGGDFADDGCVHGGDNVAESGLTIERIVPRSRLKPRYGSGWQPV